MRFVNTAVLNVEARDPVLRERVRGDLERDARRAQLRDLAVQREAIRRRERVARELRRHAVAERADVGARALRDPERLRREIRDRRLAVRARHADQRRLGQRREERVRELAERLCRFGTARLGLGGSA